VKDLDVVSCSATLALLFVIEPVTTAATQAPRQMNYEGLLAMFSLCFSYNAQGPFTRVVLWSIDSKEEVSIRRIGERKAAVVQSVYFAREWTAFGRYKFYGCSLDWDT